MDLEKSILQDLEVTCRPKVMSGGIEATRILQVEFQNFYIELGKYYWMFNF